MTMYAVRLPLPRVQHEIQALVRTFPSETISIFRNGPIVAVDDHGQPQYEPELVYRGEVLFSPAQGSVTRYGLGQVEETKPYLLVAGHRDFKEGDFFYRKGLLYQMTHTPDYWPGFTGASCTIYEQGTSTPPEHLP